MVSSFLGLIASAMFFHVKIIFFPYSYVVLGNVNSTNEIGFKQKFA